MQPTCLCVIFQEISEESECNKMTDKEQLMSDLKAKSHEIVEMWASEVYQVLAEILLVLSNLYEK